MQNATFPTEQPQPDLHRITIPRTGVVSYKDKTIIVMEGGKTLYSFRNIDAFRVYNRIEGDLFFTGNTKPQDRVFPGFGKLLPSCQHCSIYLMWSLLLGYIQIGEGFAEYAQTLVEPNVWLKSMLLTV